jgi:hypothetical protein
VEVNNTWTNTETEALYRFLSDDKQGDLCGALVDAPRRGEHDAEDGQPLLTSPGACAKVAEAMRKVAAVMGQGAIDYNQVAERLLADISITDSENAFLWWWGQINVLLWERARAHLEDALEHLTEAQVRRWFDAGWEPKQVVPAVLAILGRGKAAG